MNRLDELKPGDEVAVITFGYPTLTKRVTVESVTKGTVTTRLNDWVERWDRRTGKRWRDRSVRERIEPWCERHDEIMADAATVRERNAALLRIQRASLSRLTLAQLRAIEAIIEETPR